MFKRPTVQEIQNEIKTLDLQFCSFLEGKNEGCEMLQWKKKQGFEHYSSELFQCLDLVHSYYIALSQNVEVVKEIVKDKKNTYNLSNRQKIRILLEICNDKDHQKFRNKQINNSQGERIKRAKKALELFKRMKKNGEYFHERLLDALCYSKFGLFLVWEPGKENINIAKKNKEKSFELLKETFPYVFDSFLFDPLQLSCFELNTLNTVISSKIGSMIDYIKKNVHRFNAKEKEQFQGDSLELINGLYYLFMKIVKNKKKYGLVIASIARVCYHIMMFLDTTQLLVL